MRFSLRSGLTLVLIIALSLFGRQVLTVINAYDLDRVLAIIMAIGVLAAGWIFFPAASQWKILIFGTLAPLLATVLVAEELVHLIVFAVLGTAFAEDSEKRPELGIALGMAVCIGDELLQWALPYRVGDMKDVLLNAGAFLLLFRFERVCNPRDLP